MMKNGKSSESSGFRPANTDDTVEEDRLLTVVEAARFLNLDVGTVYHFAAAKKIPTTRLSARCLRFSRRALAEWVKSLSEPAEHDRR